MFRALNSVFCVGCVECALPCPGDAILLLPALGQHTVGMGVELDTVALLVPPAVLLLGVVEVDVAGELLPEAECRTSFRLVLCLSEEGLLNDVSWTPGIRDVNILQVHRLKVVLPSWIWQSQ